MAATQPPRTIGWLKRIDLAKAEVRPLTCQAVSLIGCSVLQLHVVVLTLILAQMVATILDFSLLAECGATRVFAALTICGSHHALGIWNVDAAIRARIEGASLLTAHICRLPNCLVGIRVRRIVSLTFWLILATLWQTAGRIINTNVLGCYRVLRPTRGTLEDFTRPLAANLIRISDSCNLGDIGNPTSTAGMRAAQRLTAVSFLGIHVDLRRMYLKASRAGYAAAGRCTTRLIADFCERCFGRVQSEVLGDVACVSLTGWLAAKALCFSIWVDFMLICPNGNGKRLAQKVVAGVFAAFLLCLSGRLLEICWHLFAFWAFHRTAGLVTALLVGSTNVALIGFIGYEIARARVQLTCRLAALHI